MLLTIPQKVPLASLRSSSFARQTENAETPAYAEVGLRLPSSSTKYGGKVQAGKVLIIINTTHVNISDYIY